MNRCPRCGKPLVLNNTAEAIDGKLYCSRHCAVLDLADRFLQDPNTAARYQDAVEIAKEYFEDCSETVVVEDVVAEDFQEVQIAVTYYKTVRIPMCIDEGHALAIAEKMWNDGTITAEPGLCDDVSFECVLVKRDNSAQLED